MNWLSSRAGKDSSIFVWPLRRITRLAVNNPVQMVTLAVVVAGFCLFFSFTDLQFKTSRLDLINQKSDFNRLWIDYIEDFGDEDDLIVVVKGEAEEKITPVLDELSAKIQTFPALFQDVLHEIDTTPLLRKGLHFVEKPEELENIRQFAAEGRQITDGHWNYLQADNYLGGLCQRLSSVGSSISSPGSDKERKRTIRELAALAGSLADAFSSKPTFQVSPLAPIEEMGALKREYFLADGGKLGVVLLKISEPKGESFTYGTRSIEKLRSIIAESRKIHPDVEIGLTGLTVMENDEMRISQTASAESSVLSLIGVAIIFIAAFGGLRHPLIAVFALIIGIAWTMGWILLSIGHLNILSMSFGVILIGLGIDFGIHYVSRYLEIRRASLDSRTATADLLMKTGETVGPGIAVGALTTAAAFFMIGLSEFTGIAELGIVSGGGVVLCCLVALFLIPALIRLVDGPTNCRVIPHPVNIYSWIGPIFRFPKTVVFLGLAVTVYFATGLPNLWYDHNLLHMQSENLESIRLEKELIKKWDKGAWFALSIADTPEELLRRKAEFEKDPTLRVEEIFSRFPSSSPEKTEKIGQIRQSLDRLPETPDEIPVGDSARLVALLGETQNLIDRSGPEILSSEARQRLIREFGGIQTAIRQLPTDQYARRIAVFQQRLAGEFLGRLQLIHLTASPEPPNLSDLPKSLVSRYVGKKSGKFLMRIYSVHEIWDMDKLQDFIVRVKKVDPRVTGNPIQTYEASLQMERSYRNASIFAFLAILFLLYLDFRSVRYTLLAILPMGIGVVWAFGLMGILGISFNPANTIVIPLILGIGIDDGVHIVHDFRQKKGRYRVTPSLAGSVVLTSLTTMVGFGSLMIAEHRGLQSLGRVLVLGVTSCMVTSIVLLPAILTWITEDLGDDEPVLEEQDESPLTAEEKKEDAEALRHRSARRPPRQRVA